ncbi:MAG: hypothetical protein BWX80_03718 [Candidatus Hydrogenedentes bacterium ADurb.Bin101]|nr:MAG: hypothetical protein BWX80_03718 [Candidatus Hydrogenedentes bacterium ADurb.Bin101]
MHGSPHALVESGFTPENFGKQSVKQEVHTQFLFLRGGQHGILLAFGRQGEAGPIRTVGLDNAKGSAVKIILHDRQQPVTGQVLYGAQPFGDNLPMTAMAAEHVVDDPQMHALTDGSAFLANRKVGRTGVGIGNGLIGTQFLDGIKHRFKLADNRHVTIYTQQTFHGQTALAREFFLYAFLIGIYGNGAKVNRGALPDFFRNNNQFLCHEVRPLSLGV